MLLELLPVLFHGVVLSNFSLLLLVHPLVLRFRRQAIGGKLSAYLCHLLHKADLLRDGLVQDGRLDASLFQVRDAIFFH